MGVDLGDVLPEAEGHSGSRSATRRFAIDAYNTLYQFLAIIRGVRGEHLKDSKGGSRAT